MASSPPAFSSPIRRWIRRSPLGHGSFGRVSLAVNLDDENLFAVKSTSLASPELLAIESELSILKTLDSPRILSFLGSDISSDNGVLSRNLFLEYMEGGSVAEIARRSAGGRLDERCVRMFTRCIVEGLAYLHEHQIVHCDIKGQNILVGSSGVKVADFGAAKRLSKSKERTRERLDSGGSSAQWLIGPEQRIRERPALFEQATTSRLHAEHKTEECLSLRDEGMGSISPRGTPLWMAPEVLLGVEQGFASDIWSLGCTVVEMSQGSPPWTASLTSDSSLEHLLFKIACTDEELPLPECLSEQCRDFLSKCLQRDARLRSTASDLLQHPFLCSVPSYPSCSASPDDPLHFCAQPQPSPRSTLEYQVTDSESSDDDDDDDDEPFSEDLTEEEDEDERMSWRCGLQSSSNHETSNRSLSNLESVSECLPSVTVPANFDWITVRRAKEDHLVDQGKELGKKAAEPLPFASDSSAAVLKKACEVNLDCLAFLLQRRMRKVAR